MVIKQIVNSTVTVPAVAIIVLVATHLRSTNVRADEQNSDRNLAAIGLKIAPDYTGNPAGGVDLGKFIKIIRTGHDYDKLHLNCGAKVTDKCYFAPVNGALLQVMPWPKFQNMTDYQLMAIWT